MVLFVHPAGGVEPDAELKSSCSNTVASTLGGVGNDVRFMARDFSPTGGAFRCAELYVEKSRSSVRILLSKFVVRVLKDPPLVMLTCAMCFQLVDGKPDGSEKAGWGESLWRGSTSEENAVETLIVVNTTDR
jgi:hypothetical protein